MNTKTHNQEIEQNTLNQERTKKEVKKFDIGKHK